MTTETSTELEEPARLTLPIEGMTCAACVVHVEGALKGVPGVVAASVNLATERATVSYLPGQAGPADFRRAVADYGYRVGESDGANPDGTAELERLSRSREIRYFRQRCIFAVAAGRPAAAGFLSRPALVAGPAAAGVPVRPPLALGAVGPWRRRCNSGPAGLSTSPAWRRCGTARPICTPWWPWGSSVAYGYSAVITVLGALAPQVLTSSGIGTGVYFDTAALIIGLILLGRWLEAPGARPHFRGHPTAHRPTAQYRADYSGRAGSGGAG